MISRAVIFSAHSWRRRDRYQGTVYIYCIRIQYSHTEMRLHAVLKRWLSLSAAVSCVDDVAPFTTSVVAPPRLPIRHRETVRNKGDSFRQPQKCGKLPSSDFTALHNFQTKQESSVSFTDWALFNRMKNSLLCFFFLWRKWRRYSYKQTIYKVWRSGLRERVKLAKRGLL